jgi:tetratricopeptide (TPR) repeat protein
MGRIAFALAAGLVATTAQSEAASRTVQARKLYNQGLYELAIKAAAEARQSGDSVDEASLILARAHLERFRQTRDARNLTEAQVALRGVDAAHLTAGAHAELTLALGQWLFLAEKFSAAAELFDSASSGIDGLGPVARDRVRDWWATAIDRQAQEDPTHRAALYQRIVDRMEAELREQPGSTAAGYWLAAAARSMGDTERAWNAALAGYVRAHVAADRGVALRADLDRLVVTAVIPERARQMSPTGEVKPAIDAMTAEWTQMKALWH